MRISEMAVSEQRKGKLNSRKFYRHKICLPISVMHYFYFIVEIKKTACLNFSSKQWIDLIFFLNFAITIVLNHGQNDE
jgi:hypothetical protein